MNDARQDISAPIAYMERTRNFYRALGYPRDYRWAENATTPFTALKKPLAAARIALVTTSYPPGDWSDDNPPQRQVWSADTATAPEALYNQNLAWDKQTTHTRDRESYLPILAMQALADRGVIGGLTARFHSVPTEYSHHRTNARDAPDIVDRVVADHADAALLVPL